MAKATVRISDNEDGTVSVKMSFDPPISDDSQPSGAQSLAIDLLSAIHAEKAKEKTE